MISYAKPQATKARGRYSPNDGAWDHRRTDVIHHDKYTRTRQHRAPRVLVASPVGKCFTLALRLPGKPPLVDPSPDL